MSPITRSEYGEKHRQVYKQVQIVFTKDVYAALSLGLDIGAQNLNIEAMTESQGILYTPYAVGICIV